MRGDGRELNYSLAEVLIFPREAAFDGHTDNPGPAGAGVRQRIAFRKGERKPLHQHSRLWLYFAAQNRMLQGRQRMQIFYSGRVQGVGFRYSTKMLARGYEVAGTVRNLPDGRVELVGEGARAELEAFRKGLQESELGSFIRNEEIHWSEAKNEFRGFEIVR